METEWTRTAPTVGGRCDTAGLRGEIVGLLGARASAETSPRTARRDGPTRGSTKRRSPRLGAAGIGVPGGADELFRRVGATTLVDQSDHADDADDRDKKKANGDGERHQPDGRSPTTFKTMMSARTMTAVPTTTASRSRSRRLHCCSISPSCGRSPTGARICVPVSKYASRERRVPLSSSFQVLRS